MYLIITKTERKNTLILTIHPQLTNQSSHKSGQKSNKTHRNRKKEQKFRNYSKTQTKYVLQISSLFLKTATTVIYGIQYTCY
jgi:hypothetical protein